MQSPEHDDLARGFGKALAAIAAPEELPFFDEMLDAADRGPLAHKDRGLAFGIPLDGVALPLLLLEIGKVVIAAIWESSKPLLADVAKEAGDEMKKALIIKIKEWILKKFSSRPPVKLSDEALSKIQDAANKILKEGGTSPEESEKILKSVRSALSGQV